MLLSKERINNTYRVHNPDNNYTYIIRQLNEDDDTTPRFEVKELDIVLSLVEPKIIKGTIDSTILNQIIDDLQCNSFAVNHEHQTEWQLMCECWNTLRLIESDPFADEIKVNQMPDYSVLCKNESQKEK